ncbi:MAG: NUDIX domain-containing protein [Anaerolineales bacterium]|nr:NUDIX domain-containing protein [Anaerolineales bacterium]
MKRKVRVSAKAIIIRDGRLLAMHHVDAEGNYFLLPGGGQHNGETLISAVERECQEEAGVKIEVGDVLFIRDYIEANHEFARDKPDFHQVEIMFQCKLLDDSKVGRAEEMDTRQIGVCWIPLGEIEKFRIYPKILKTLLKDNKLNKQKIYLGDVN